VTQSTANERDARPGRSQVTNTRRGVESWIPRRAAEPRVAVSRSLRHVRRVRVLFTISFSVDLNIEAALMGVNHVRPSSILSRLVSYQGWMRHSPKFRSEQVELHGPLFY
jgi:hypothetical protein